MFTRHITERLAAHLDGQLLPGKARQAELHLRGCATCRAELEEVRRGMALLEHLPPVEAPEAIWQSIETALRTLPSEPPAVRPWRWALAATLLLALAGAGYWSFGGPRGTRWEVVRVEGAPAVAAKVLQGAGRIGAGEWIETDSKSRARVEVGTIGSVDVLPNTRLRVVTTGAAAHRLALARGEIRATISAPPRLFLVDTAGGTAVDLGCEYELRADEEGSARLHVTKGWVSFEWKGRDSLVPAGASCLTLPREGPGMPYFDDASESLKQAVEAFGHVKSSDNGLDIILSQSRVRDTLTLWHLLRSVEGADRERVFDRMAALTPLPAGVSREQALKLDPATLKRWMEELAWTW